MRRLGTWLAYTLFPRWLQRRLWAVKGCVESSCAARRGKDRLHGPCTDCGKLTCGTALRIDPASLRRHKVRCCEACYCRVSDESELRRKRTHLDWERQLPDQFPGPTRSGVKDFLDSDNRERHLGNGDAVQAGVYNDCLGSLGLGAEAYAEVRGHEVWLRRLHNGTAAAVDAAG